MEGYLGQKGVCKPPAHSLYSRERQQHSLPLPPRCLPALLPTPDPLSPVQSHSRQGQPMTASCFRDVVMHSAGTLHVCFQFTLTTASHILAGSRTRLEPIPFLPLKGEVLYPLSHICSLVFFTSKTLPRVPENLESIYLIHMVCGLCPA